MATTAITALQSPLVAIAELGVSNVGSGNGLTVSLPAGALTTAMGVNVQTAFNGTTNTVSVSDGTTTFVSAEDAKAAGAVAVDRQVKYYPTGGTITFSLAETGTTSAGAAQGFVAYVVIGRQTEQRG